MQVVTFTKGPYATNSYLVVCNKTKEGAVIDVAPGSASAIEEAAKGITVGKILITHSHWDHIADCKELSQRLGSAVFVHREDAENLSSPGADGLPYPLDEPIEGVEPAGFLEDGDRVEVGGITFEVIHTPGHSPGLIIFYSKDEGTLFCGDLFFKGALGSLALPTAEPDRMWPSLKRVTGLPSDTVVYPGHGEVTTVGAEQWLARAEEIYGGDPFEKGDFPWTAKK